MKFVRKKIIKNHEYYYLEYPLKVSSGRFTVTKYIGDKLPQNFNDLLGAYFDGIAAAATNKIGDFAKAYFAPKSILPVEQGRFWYQSMHCETMESDLKLFRSLFSILFILNSNRAEGSKVTRKDIEKLINRVQKPKTPLDLEILNSLAALRFAFSATMKWNIKSIKILHRLLFERISPEIAGKLKRTNVTVNNEPTTDWQNSKKELAELLRWFIKQKKSTYPPILALEFHYKFEAIHPFEDGNGRIGRLLLNAFLLKSGYMPVIFFSENHGVYTDAISKARQGRKRKLAHYFINQLIKTKRAVLTYKKEGIVKGGSPQVGRWEIERGKIRKY